MFSEEHLWYREFSTPFSPKQLDAVVENSTMSGEGEPDKQSLTRTRNSLWSAIMELKSMCRLIYKQHLSRCHIVFHIVIHAILKPNHIAFLIKFLSA